MVMDHVYVDDYDGDEYECDDYNGSDAFEWQDMEGLNTKTFFLPPNVVTKILCKVFPLTLVQEERAPGASNQGTKFSWKIGKE